jgi:hypothetical protein
VVHIEILPFYLSWLNRICNLHIYLTVVYHLKIGVRIWLIMDISFVSDGATRGTPEGFRADQASGSQQPPPATPNLAEVMAQQTELLNQLV